MEIPHTKGHNAVTGHDTVRPNKLTLISNDFNATTPGTKLKIDSPKLDLANDLSLQYGDTELHSARGSMKLQPINLTQVDSIDRTSDALSFDIDSFDRDIASLEKLIDYTK